MIKNRKLIEGIIKDRKEVNDPVKEFCVRNKDSPIKEFQAFQPYFYNSLDSIVGNADFDGLKLKFRFVTLYINARYSNK